MLQPTNVATPATAVCVFGNVGVQVRVAPTAGAVIARVTTLVSVVTVLVPASWTVTTGWVVKAVPPVEPTGWVVKASRAAGPRVIATDALVAAVSAPSAACNV